MGSTPEEMGRIEQIANYVHDLKMKSTMPCYRTDDKAAIVEECRPLLKQIADNLGGFAYLSHGGVSWVDFKFFELLDLLHFLSDGVFY